MSVRAMIPLVFNWLLLAQAPVAAVAIYSSVFVFGAGTVPSVLAVVATALHLLLGIYCCVARAAPGSYHIYGVLSCLVVCAGLWCGSLCYFAWHITLLAGRPEATDRRLFAAWTKAGCAMAVLSISLDLLLLGVFLLTSTNQQPQDPEKASFTSSSTDNPPQLPPLTPLPHHRISLPYPPTATPPPNPTRNPHIPPTIIPVPPEHRTKPLPPPPPQQQQQHPPQPSPYYHETIDPSAPLNRIHLILALCALQNPHSGNWPPSRELASLLKLWTGGRDVTLGMGPTGRGATALAHACLIDLCQFVWAAQREGREGEVLSWAEIPTPPINPTYAVREQTITPTINHP
ncbi:hypothetical protein C8A01DRAFT_32473 [Parachaetomium inaequale]|uniref:MARVEL domain-containing protein n=1 Tax=Parachaetomium inaequale TaxID=2588326 RepID=A0AAN6PLW1_9PEZI|nr:hypothetical protein C8A01DRAFT_32473 [Parachaetomium inaequale]